MSKNPEALGYEKAGFGISSNLETLDGTAEPGQEISPESEPAQSSLVATIEDGVASIGESVTAIGESVEKILTQPAEVTFLNVLKAEIPYIIMLCMAIFGIGLVTLTGGLPGLYWELLTVVYCALCIYIGWGRAPTRPERVKLVRAQVLHWASFLAAMSLIYTPTMRSLVDVNATGLNLMVLLALGTFVAGVHAEAWQVCVVGLILAGFVPAMAIIQRSSLFFMIATLGVTFVAFSLWTTFHAHRRGKEEAA